jgi:hypothetical protein
VLWGKDRGIPLLLCDDFGFGVPLGLEPAQLSRYCGVIVDDRHRRGIRQLR